MRELISGVCLSKPTWFRVTDHEDWTEPVQSAPYVILKWPSEPTEQVRTAAWYFWKFVHNALIHPWLALPWEPRWTQRAHDWTAKRCFGGG